MVETSTNGAGARTTGAKDFGTKVKEGAKNAVEKVRRLSDDLVKKIKGKPKEGGATTTPDAGPTTTTPGVTPGKSATSARPAK